MAITSEQFEIELAECSTFNVAKIAERIPQWFSGKAWEVKGFKSWDELCAARLGHFRLATNDRQAVAGRLNLAGMSNRAIGLALNVAEGTIRNDLDTSTAQDCAVETKTEGKDGNKRKSPASPTERADRQAKVAVLFLSGMPQAEIGRTLDIAKTTLERDIRACKDSGAIPSNKPKPIAPPVELPRPEPEQYQIDRIIMGVRKIARDSISDDWVTRFATMTRDAEANNDQEWIDEMREVIATVVSEYGKMSRILGDPAYCLQLIQDRSNPSGHESRRNAPEYPALRMVESA